MSDKSPTTTWRAVCGVDGSRWMIEATESPSVFGTYCPDCRERRMMAPGVLHWKPDAVKEVTDAT